MFVWVALRVMCHDLWYWLVQIAQPCLMILLVLFLAQGAMLPPSSWHVFKVMLYWLSGLWLQLSMMHVLWKGSTPVFAWRLSDYPISLFVLIRCCMVFVGLIMPCATILGYMLLDSGWVMTWLHFLMCQWICLMFSMVFSYMLHAEHRISQLGMLFMMPVYLPVMLLAAGPDFVVIPALSGFVSNVLLAGICLAIALLIAVFDGVLSRLS